MRAGGATALQAGQAPVVVVYVEESNFSAALMGDVELAAACCTVAMVDTVIDHIAADVTTTARQHADLRGQRELLFARLPKFMAQWVPLDEDDADAAGTRGVPDTEPQPDFAGPPHTSGDSASTTEMRDAGALPVNAVTATAGAAAIADALRKGAQWEQSTHRSGGEVLYMPHTNPPLVVGERDRPTTRRALSRDEDSDDGYDGEESDTRGSST